MATIRAISAVAGAVVAVLEAQYDRALFNNDLEFAVYTGQSFRSPMTAGVSLFVYRVFHNGTNRLPAGRPRTDGRRSPPRLPIDVHFILTAWAPTPSLEHAIVAWMMRTLEDHPILPAGLLNHGEPGAFLDDEIVEVAPIELTTEDLLKLWERLPTNRYVLSVPYMARTILIDSLFDAEAPRPVRERVSELGRLTGGA